MGVVQLPPMANSGVPSLRPTMSQGGVEANIMPRKRDIPSGPAVTVFVGNITERAPDPMVRHLLTTCGIVLSWKRVQGATGQLQAFGFCEFSNPDAGLRAVRILNEFTIADKSLVCKVDAKTKRLLLDYLKERMKKNDVDEPEDEEEMLKYTDDDMKYDDTLANDRIKQILTDHKSEIESYVPRENVQFPIQTQNKATASDTIQKIGSRDEGLEGVEDEKKGVISKEIEKFRETMKVRETEREEAEKNKRDRRSSPSSRRSRDRSREKENRERESRSDSRRTSRRRSPSQPRQSRVSRSRSREREREREREKERERERQQEREERERDRERRTRERSSERERKSAKEIEKEREKEQEEKDKRKAERKAAEKEVNYRTRLENWERREAKKLSDYEKDKKKEKKKAEEMEREGRKLKEFLEDYDDEKDDSKYYKNRELARRMGDREREAAKDLEDRRKEEEELAELKDKIYSNPTVKDPESEYQRRVREKEQEFLPPGVKLKEPAPPSPETIHLPQSPASPDRDGGGAMSPGSDGGYDDYDNGNGADMGEPSPEPAAPEPTINPITLPGATKLDAPGKRRKMQVADIFNQDNDDDDDHKPKKKLKTALPPSATAEKKDKAGANNVDDKKKHIKTLIEKIPTDKTALFEYSIDWDLVDNQLMEKRIRPWINKKIAEYIGEPEPSLTDFICSKVLAGSAPKAILDDVQMVLDDEAEVFVVKMWRLLIYEIENKKQKAMGGVK